MANFAPQIKSWTPGAQALGFFTKLVEANQAIREQRMKETQLAQSETTKLLGLDIRERALELRTTQLNQQHQIALERLDMQGRVNEARIAEFNANAAKKEHDLDLAKFDAEAYMALSDILSKPDESGRSLRARMFTGNDQVRDAAVAEFQDAIAKGNITSAAGPRTKAAISEIFTNEKIKLSNDRYEARVAQQQAENERKRQAAEQANANATRRMDETERHNKAMEAKKSGGATVEPGTVTIKPRGSRSYTTTEVEDILAKGGTEAESLRAGILAIPSSQKDADGNAIPLYTGAMLDKWKARGEQRAKDGKTSVTVKDKKSGRTVTQQVDAPLPADPAVGAIPGDGALIPDDHPGAGIMPAPAAKPKKKALDFLLEGGALPPLPDMSKPTGAVNFDSIGNGDGIPDADTFSPLQLFGGRQGFGGFGSV